MYFSAPTSPYHNYNLLLRLLKLVREMLKPEHERKTLRRVYHSAARKAILQLVNWFPPFRTGKVLPQMLRQEQPRKSTAQCVFSAPTSPHNNYIEHPSATFQFRQRNAEART